MMIWGHELLQLVTWLVLLLILISVPVGMFKVMLGGKMDWFLLPRALLRLFGRGTNALAKYLRFGAKKAWNGRRGQPPFVQFLLSLLAGVLGGTALVLGLFTEIAKALK